MSCWNIYKCSVVHSTACFSEVYIVITPAIICFASFGFLLS